MIVTTAQQPADELVKKAQRLAAELQAPLVPRQRHTIARLARQYDAACVLVVAEDGLKAVSGTEPPLFFHPSMGLVRIKRLLGGGTDNMLAAASAMPGDTVLDCTAGLASDAIVFSCAVGPSGSVTAIEASPLLCAIVREGLQSASTGLAEADEACRRIRLVCGEHEQVMRGMADRSVDIVYFDPMFEQPIGASDAIRPLRTYARSEPLAASAVREAVRVARKSVVMKNTRGSAEFARLGFTPLRASRSAVAYGVIRL